MQQFPAATLTRDPLALKEAARKAPVTITEYNRPRFVMMSYENYLALTGSPPDPRLSLRVSDMPEQLRDLAQAALDQPYDD